MEIEWVDTCKWLWLGPGHHHHLKVWLLFVSFIIVIILLGLWGRFSSKKKVGVWSRRIKKFKIYWFGMGSCVSLPGAKGAQLFGQILCQICLWRCFGPRLTFKIKQIPLPNVGGQEQISWRPKQNQTLTSPKEGHILLPSSHWTMASALLVSKAVPGFSLNWDIRSADLGFF